MSEDLDRAAAEVERLRAGVKALIVEPDDPDDDNVRLRNYHYALSVASYLLDVASEHLAALLNPTEGETGLPLHRTEAGYPNCSTCDGGGCLDCTDPA